MPIAPIAISYALEIIGAIPKIIALGVDVSEYLKDIESVLKKAKSEGRDITDAELDALNPEIEALRKQRPNVSEE